MAFNKGNKTQNRAHMSSHEIAFKSGKVDVVIPFRKDATFTFPEEITASGGGGIAVKGMYDASTLEGVISADFNLIDSLTKAYRRDGLLNFSSAIVRVFTSQGQIVTSYFFDNAYVATLPQATHKEHGEEGLYTVKFTLSDCTNVVVEQLKV